MAGIQIKLLEETHPDYDAGELSRYRALFAGGRVWRQQAASFLARRDAESPERYSKRLAEATYTNEAGPLVESLVGQLFSAPLKAAGWPSDWWSTWERNVDRKRRDLNGFIADRVIDACIEGSAWVLVNRPRRPDDVELVSRADEEAVGLLDVFLVGYTATQAIRWGEDEDGRPAWVVFRDTREVNTFGTKRATLKRWTYVDAEVMRVFEAPEDASEDSIAEEVLSVEHKVGRLPAVRLELGAARHPMAVLHDPAVALLRARNALTWSLENCAYAMPVFKTLRRLDDVVGGVGYFLHLDPGDSVEWSEPGGTSLAALAADVASKRDDLYRAMRSLFQASHSDALQQQSGASKDQDWRALLVFLEGLRSTVVTFVYELVEVVGAARKERTEQVELTGLDGWSREDAAAWLEQITVAEPWLKKSETAHREVLHRVVDAVLPDLDPEVAAQIAQEIEDADLTELTVPFALPPLGASPGVGPGGRPPREEPAKD